MDRNKRHFLRTMISCALAAPAAMVARRAFAQQPGAGRPPTPFPGRPGDMNPDDAPPKIDPKELQERNQREIHKDVEKLFTLAQELKEAVEKTDSTSVLSLSLVQKAKEVEKLAHQIANLTVG
ncbi:MAG TPA: hypothetical protein VEG64_14565 [Candidatus Sulfotelmatobacter sp.]|nr:hypothetical protein [Candidatus Sulfotelmatobacter sp.]